jgi:hypothetical protein
VIRLLRQKEVRMTALVKIGLLFVSGLGIGLLVPLSRDRPTRFIPRPNENEVQETGTPTLTVHCIIEQPGSSQPVEASSDTGTAPGVEVIVHPTQRRLPPTPADVVVRLRMGNKAAGNRLMPRTE